MVIKLIKVPILPEGHILVGRVRQNDQSLKNEKSKCWQHVEKVREHLHMSSDSDTGPATLGDWLAISTKADVHAL